MKNILLLVHDDAGQEARLQAALDLTRALEGHLICLDVTVIPLVVGEFDAGYAQMAALVDEQEREDRNRAELQVRLAREDVSWSWVDAAGGLALAMKEAAGLADIIVVNRRLDTTSYPDMRGLAAELVIASGKAVVAVPEQGAGMNATGTALVAWDGSAEAMDAVSAAVPLLQLARLVTIVEVEDSTIETPAEEAAAYLSRHGIKPVVVRRRLRDDGIAGILLREAKAEKADYVVMGGFGHSRLVEAVFGGVSREMLSESPIPVVMSH